MQSDMETAKPAVKESKADKKARRAARVEKKGDVDNKPPPAQAQTESHKPEKPSSESAEKKVVTKAERRAIQVRQQHRSLFPSVRFANGFGASVRFSPLVISEY